MIPNQPSANGKTCSPFREALRQQSYDGEPLTAADAAQRLHLAACAACRDEVVSTRDLLDELSAALRPAPLAPEFVNAIMARVERAKLAAPLGRVIRFSPAPWIGAAAACLMAAACLRPVERVSIRADAHGGSATMTESDANEIARALGLLEWNSPLDKSIERTRMVLKSVERVVDRDPAADTVLPWDADDDWDLAPKHSGAS